MDVLTVGAIGPKRSLTPEGFLLCEDVVFTRSGTLIYGTGEIPVTPGHDGLIHVLRSTGETTRPETVASFQGKPVVDEHPATDVGPDNWKELSVGIALNVRTSTIKEGGEEIAVLVCDMLITDAQAIKDIRAGKREVSAGYDADYEETEPGQALQTDIIGNHIALVEKGRCGPRCSIGDNHHTVKGKKSMPTPKKTGTRRVQLKERIRQAFRDAEAAALEDFESDPSSSADPLGDDPGGDADAGGDTHTHVHVHMGGAGTSGGPDTTKDEVPDDMDGGDDPIESRFAALEAGHAQILEQLASLTAALGGGGAPPATQPKAPEGGEASTKDESLEMSDKPDDDKPRAATADSAALERSWQSMLADAQILSPGFRAPTFDAAAKRTKTIDNMCAMRRRVLASAAQTLDTRQLIERIADVPFERVSQMTCDAVAPVFRAAALAKRAANNAQGARTEAPTTARPVTTVADIAAAFDRMYAPTSAT